MASEIYFGLLRPGSGSKCSSECNGDGPRPPKPRKNMFQGRKMSKNLKRNWIDADTKMAFGLTNSKMAFGPAENMLF